MINHEHLPNKEKKNLIHFRLTILLDDLHWAGGDVGWGGRVGPFSSRNANVVSYTFGFD